MGFALIQYPQPFYCHVRIRLIIAWSHFSSRLSVGFDNFLVRNWPFQFVIGELKYLMSNPAVVVLISDLCAWLVSSMHLERKMIGFSWKFNANPFRILWSSVINCPVCRFAVVNGNNFNWHYYGKNDFAIPDNYIFLCIVNLLPYIVGVTTHSAYGRYLQHERTSLNFNLIL